MEGNPGKRRTSIHKLFRELPSQDNDGQVLPISDLWNTAMAHPNDPEFIELGIFKCMNLLTVVHAGFIPPFVELLRGRLTWVEQRVAVRALGHLTTHASTFSAISNHGEILELPIQLAMSCLEIVYTLFYQYVDRRLSYPCDLLTRGMGGVQMESMKAEEWASQLQCWSLQLINCFVFEKVVPILQDLSEISTLGDHTKLGDSVVSALAECVVHFTSAAGRSSLSDHMKEEIEEVLNAKQRLKSEKNMTKEYLHIKQAAALVVKLEGNSQCSARNIVGAAAKYLEAISLFPMRSKKERVVLYSNRAQCHLLLQQHVAAISDATRALCLHNPVQCHAKSLWRRAQAYDMLGFAKESLLDATLFINECCQLHDLDLSS
ncbi:Tetratricopeptide repeat protein 1 [Bienertia sinuspersici]